MKKIRLLAIVIALVMAAGLFLVLQKVDKPEEKTVNVVVAATDVAQNSILTAEMVVVKAVPEDMVLGGVYTEVESLIGKVAKVNLKTGEQIIVDRISEIGDRTAGDLAMMVEEGKRAITIAVDAVTGLSNMIHPGDNIDVIAHIEQEADADDTEMISMTLVENVPVLAVDNVMSNQGKADGYATITIMVTPDQANEIDWTANTGALRVVLRTPLDENKANAEDVTMSNIGE